MIHFMGAEIYNIEYVRNLAAISASRRTVAALPHAFTVSG